MDWWSRFDLYYRPLGPERSVLGAYKAWRAAEGRQRQTEPRRAPESWYKAAEKWDWDVRAQAWDKAQMDALRDQESDKWLARQLEAREKEWTAAEALWQRIEEMMRFPLAAVSRPNEAGGTTVINPTKWSHRDIAAFAKAASDLARQATEMATSRSHLEVDLSVKEFLDALPPGLRAQVREHLAAALQRGADQGGD
jgi:hypothetical protein